MSALPLPNKSVPFSQQGFTKLYDSVRTNQAEAMVIADAIEADPRGALEHVFKLTKQQKDRFDGMSKEELLRRAQVLLRELRSATPKSLALHHEHSEEVPDEPDERQGGDPRDWPDGGSCFVLVVL